ncbi:glycosyltransferase [Acidithiobacillus ferriphilus]|uniref:glycosyltransferase n=1 Tax=Acidithiobacillus ferriphilus TaxID=1689834 RepID=UPI00242D8DA0|nr:glycosyltransferase [Acidithiobacillus ferriphilus]MBW9255535.1 glycosyltransferase [Acidithiobacillus ferriphilus]
MASSVGRVVGNFIILLNWNASGVTLRCLRALEQVAMRERVLVVDNGSAADDLERLRLGMALLPYPAELEEAGRNLGFGGGCNVGMRLALERGAEFVWLLNNDAVPHSDAMQAMLRVMGGDAQIGAVGSVIYDLERPERVQTWGGGRVWRWAGVARHRRWPVAARRLDYLTAASILLRREALERTGLFDDDTFFMYWEDADLCFRLRAQGWKLAVAGDAMVWHQRSSSLGHANPLKDYYVTVSSRRFLRRYAPGSRLAMTLGALVRIARRLLRGRWRNVRAIVSALWDRPYDLALPLVMDAGKRDVEPLRVAVEATTLSGRLAGIGHYTAALCQQVVTDGSATLAYFTARSWAQEPPRQPGLRIPRPLQWRKRIPLGRELQFVLQGRQLARLERIWRPDLILGPSFVLPRAKAPSVLVVHDLSHLRYPEVHPPARVAFLNRHLRPAMARAGAVLTDSRFTEAELLHYFPEVAGRTHVVYPGISGRFASAPVAEVETALDGVLLGDERRFFLFLSTLEPRKNLAGLLAAYAALPAAIRRAHPLVLVWQMGWQETNFAAILMGMLARGEVRMLGYLRDELLPALYRRALALVYPSLYEGFGLPPIEAMATGCPVLVANVSALPEVCGDAALYCDPLDVRSITAAMRRLAEDEVLRARLAAAGPARAALYTWEAAAAQALAVMREVVSH